MKQESLNQRLGDLWASVIDGITIDLAAHRIELTLHTIDGDKREEHGLSFHGVSAFYYVKDRGEKRFRLPTAATLELTSASYVGMERIRIEALLPRDRVQYSSSPGFLLEIWTSLLFVEASSAVVDGDRFDLNLEPSNES